LEGLARHVRESSSVSILDGDDIVYVARVPVRRIMTVSITVGTRFPAYATSMGRVLLAGLSDDEIANYLSRVNLAPLTDRTVTTPAALQREIMRTRSLGYCVVDGELEQGLRSVAAPVHDGAGEVVAAVNISTHTVRSTAATVRRDLVPALLATTAAISSDLARVGRTS
jgi:IclR family pca regulon transcriptional regulator